MKNLLFCLLIISLNVFGEASPEACNLGIYTTANEANAAAKSKAESLFPSYIAENPDACPESSNTKRNAGVGTFGGLIIDSNGMSAWGYTPGANINVVSGCWVCPVYCGVGWDNYKACVVQSCPLGYGLVDGRCVQYILALPPENPDTECTKAGNPIDTSTGAKTQKENDIEPAGLHQIEFTRTYSNANKNKGGYWYTSYQQSLRIIDPTKIETVREKKRTLRE